MFKKIERSNVQNELIQLKRCYITLKSVYLMSNHVAIIGSKNDLCNYIYGNQIE